MRGLPVKKVQGEGLKLILWGSSAKDLGCLEG